MPALTADTPPVQQKKAAPRQSFHYKVVISLYRVFAITVLYLVLGGILAYAFVMGFYAVSNSWAAPIILSAADEKSLDFREKLVTSQQTIEDLKVDTTKLESGVAEMKSTGQRSSGAGRNSTSGGDSPRARRTTDPSGPKLATLDTQKQADNLKTQNDPQATQGCRVEHQQRSGCRPDHERRRGHPAVRTLNRIRAKTITRTAK